MFIETPVSNDKIDELLNTLKRKHDQLKEY